MNRYDPWALAIGLGLLALSYVAAAHGGFVDRMRGVYVDFGEFRYLVSLLFFVIGALFVYDYWRRGQ